MTTSKPTLTLSQPGPARTVDPRLLVGDPAPWFQCASNVNPSFDFSTAAGRYVVLTFFGSTAHPVGKSLIESFFAAAEIFADPDFYCFGVSVDPADRARADLTQTRPGFDIFWDAERKVAQRYYFAGADTPITALQPVTYLLDPNLHVVGIFATNDGRLQADSVVQVLKRLPKLGSPRPSQMQAPVLVVPHVLERDLCQRLIEGYRGGNPAESGFMVERDGKTVQQHDHRHKRRSDWTITDRALIETVQERFRRRLLPEIKRAFAFDVTRMERHIVACYDQSGGYFRAHRDNTTKGTAHRRFAVTVNLNAEDYVGGDLMFPEFGRATYRAPTGGAVVFSCSLLHEALPIIRGQRFAYLPFLYDEAAAAIRQANNSHLGEGVQIYQMQGPRPALAPQDKPLRNGNGGKGRKDSRRGPKGGPGGNPNRPRSGNRPR
ncbi:redoxin domain-containing protein [Dongia rigui]|uniref:Redoxin domain-containing protein n=1 Tax=Dongia rigui TaxID=940149 RepID=A0ABU5E242_9PROT|nr:redoxin domain-containing protein [Dongia rigui]MDY0873621.1 redoxin domain-containing protein [Dongia rigui]